MQIQVLLLVLLAWHAAIVTGFRSVNDAHSTFKFTDPPLSPEVASSSPLAEHQPSSNRTSEGPIPPDYLPKPPDDLNDADSTFDSPEPPLFPEVAPSPPLQLPSPNPTSEGPIPPDYLPNPPDLFSPSNGNEFYFPPPPGKINLPKWAKKVDGNFFLREYRRNLALLSVMDQKRVQADVLVYGDSITALNKPTNLSTGLIGSRAPFSRNFGDLNAEPLGIPADRIGNLMWRLAIGRERPTFRTPKVRRRN